MFRKLIAAAIATAVVVSLAPCWAEDEAKPAEEAKPAQEAKPEVKGTPIEITAVDLSPTYPWAQEDFDKLYAPEIDAEKDKVEWKKEVKLKDGAINFVEALGQNVENVAIYARVTLEADTDCKVHLSMGSDDGIAVFVNGKNAFRNNVMRAMTPDEDRADIDLAKGKTVLLFRVTQGGGEFSLQVAAKATTEAKVTQVHEAAAEKKEAKAEPAPAEAAKTE